MPYSGGQAVLSKCTGRGWKNEKDKTNQLPTLFGGFREGKGGKEREKGKSKYVLE